MIPESKPCAGPFSLNRGASSGFKTRSAGYACPRKYVPMRLVVPVTLVRFVDGSTTSDQVSLKSSRLGGVQVLNAATSGLSIALTPSRSEK